MTALGFDTSNYTTSAAAFDGAAGQNCSRLLDVKPGELGLRQSDALFAHVKRLPELTAALAAQADLQDIAAVGVSTRPRAVEGSYMPCFLAGECAARCMGSALRVPVYDFSHQQGHLAAAAWSAGRMELLDSPFLSWHLSGGTTELLLVEPEGKNVCCTKIGGTTDISAGQLIDRTGQLLGLPFPSGKHLDALSREAEKKDSFRVKCADCYFSLSGIQNKVTQYFEQGNPLADTAAYALRCVSGAVYKATEQALERFPGLEVLFSGGVASNSMLRERMREFSPVFAEPQYSTDNAMGIAVLTALQEGL